MPSCCTCLTVHSKVRSYLFGSARDASSKEAIRIRTTLKGNEMWQVRSNTTPAAPSCPPSTPSPLLAIHAQPPHQSRILIPLHFPVANALTPIQHFQHLGLGLLILGLQAPQAILSSLDPPTTHTAPVRRCLLQINLAAASVPRHHAPTHMTRSHLPTHQPLPPACLPAEPKRAQEGGRPKNVHSMHGYRKPTRRLNKCKIMAHHTRYRRYHVPAATAPTRQAPMGTLVGEAPRLQPPVTCMATSCASET
jgi:hypothetical protein